MDLCDHSLTCYVSTGLGDRLLDMCGLAVLRDALGCRDANIVLDEHNEAWCYDIALFRDTPTIVSLSVPSVTNKLRVSGSPGSSLHPLKICKVINKYNIRGLLSINECFDRFVRYATGIRPSILVEKHIPPGIDEAVGIHLRRSDKVVDDNSYHSTTTADYDEIIDVLKRDIILRIQKGEKQFFVCSEDQRWRLVFIEWLRGVDPDVVILTSNPVETRYNNLSGIDAVIDFFCLARCKAILQGIGYSTYSMVASLVYSKSPIYNYTRMVQSPRYLLNWWAPVINLISTFDIFTDLSESEQYVSDIVCPIDGTRTFNQSSTVISLDVREPERVFRQIFKPIIYMSKKHHNIISMTSGNSHQQT